MFQMNTQEKSTGKMSKLDVLALAFGAMIGWGWVVLSGEWIKAAGSLGAILAFAIGGIAMLLVGQVFAELTSAMPDNDGVLVFCKRAFDNRAAFICTWALLLSYISVVAFEGVALPTVVEYLFPNYLKGYLYTIAGFDVYGSWLAVGIISSLLIAIVNFKGVQTAMILQKATTAIIALVGILLFIGAVINGDSLNFRPFFVDGFSGVLTVAVMTPFMYVGFDVIPQTAAEANMAPRKLGKFLMISIIMAIVWYIGIVWAVSRTMTNAELQTTVLATADAMSNAYKGTRWASTLLIIGGVSGIISSWNSFYIGGSHIICSLAQAGMLPASLGKINARTNTAGNAILLIAAVTTFAPLLGRNMLVWLSDAGGLGVVVCLMLVAASFIQLRKKMPDMKRPFTAGKTTAVGWAALIASVLFTALYVVPGMPSALVWPYEWLIIIGWSLIGVVFYAYSNRTKK